MNTFKLTQPIFNEENVTSINDMKSSFSDFLTKCGLKLVDFIKTGESTTNYTIIISGKNGEFPIEAIIGKKYIRLMNKRLNPTITTQITYDKDLEQNKYEQNVRSIVDNVKELSEYERKISAKIARLSKLETTNDLEYYKSKYSVDKIEPIKNGILLTKSIDDATDLIIKLYGLGDMFQFSVEYPKNEVFYLLSNFLPENNFEPKMSGINGRMEEYNKISGEIIQKVINDEKD